MLMGEDEKNVVTNMLTVARYRMLDYKCSEDWRTGNMAISTRIKSCEMEGLEHVEGISENL
jgi:hypothetical protein